VSIPKCNINKLLKLHYISVIIEANEVNKYPDEPNSPYFPQKIIVNQLFIKRKLPFQ